MTGVFLALILGVSQAAAVTSDCRITAFGPDWGDPVLRGDGSAASMGHSLNVFGKPREFRLTVKGTPGAMVRLHIGSHFQGFSRAMGPLSGEEQTFTVPAPPDGWAHSGAAENNVSYPLRVQGVSAKFKEGPCEVELIELRCVTEVDQDRAVTLLPRLTQLGQEDGKRLLKAQCSGWNLLDKPVSGVVRMVVRDWEDRVLQDKLRAWTIEPGGAEAIVEFTAEIPEQMNFADAELVFESEAAGARGRASYTRPVMEEGDSQLRPDSPWGMGVYLYRYPMPGPGEDTMAQAALLAQRAGVKWSREEFSWQRLEPRKGEFDFAFYDAVVDTARRHGISVYGMMAYWSPWTKAYTEEGIDDYVAFARAVVRHFKDRVKHWEIYNEPNIFFWDGPKELYPVMMKRAYDAIKEEDPEATVLAISTAGIDEAFIKRCLDAGAPFDVLTVHPYRKKLVEYSFMHELAQVAKLVSNRPVWITEMGWSTQQGNVSEREQAQLLARTYLSAVASGACQNVSWYDFRNDGRNPFYNEDNFGVTYADLSPKPSYRALATVCREMSAPEPREVGGLQGVHLLGMGGTTAVWSSLEKDCLGVLTGKVDRKSVRAVNLMGDPVEVKAGRRKLRVALRPGCPVFVKGMKVEEVRVKK